MKKIDAIGRIVENSRISTQVRKMEERYAEMTNLCGHILGTISVNREHGILLVKGEDRLTTTKDDLDWLLSDWWKKYVKIQG